MNVISDDDDAQVVAEENRTATVLVNRLNYLNGVKTESDRLLADIERIHANIRTDPTTEKIRVNFVQLVNLYESTIQASTTELDAIKHALSSLGEVFDERNRRRGLNGIPPCDIEGDSHWKLQRTSTIINSLEGTIPRWKPSSRTDVPPPLCGAIPGTIDGILPVGSWVCALTSGDGSCSSSNYSSMHDDSQMETWILAVVVRQFVKERGMYEVEDIMGEDTDNGIAASPSRHTLPLRAMTPLPLWEADPSTHPQALFPVGKKVIALYPQTTCFYEAVVSAQPGSSRGTQYLLKFKDDEDADGRVRETKVPQRFVVLPRKM